MDDADKKLEALHDAVDDMREAARRLVKELDSMADELASIRTLAMNWRLIAQEVNGVDVADEPPDE